METWTLREFIAGCYDIDSLVRAKLQDPLKQIMEADCLPCDGVRPVEGVLQKVVFLDDTEEEFIPVVELLAMDEDDASKHENADMLDIWKTYMGELKVEPMTMDMLINSAKLFMQNYKSRQESLLDV
ncbi:hypothetical protein [Bacteroides acidifaciens]|uniref:hypothetical protein n=1 Tax=Bacteroides acidifaciens TaxID=85831 RepID=UPI0025AA0890|nr:hypothetical protein [Bacteroides acidifaciens]